MDLAHLACTLAFRPSRLGRCAGACNNITRTKHDYAKGVQEGAADATPVRTRGRVVMVVTHKAHALLAHLPVSRRSGVLLPYRHGTLERAVRLARCHDAPPRALVLALRVGRARRVAIAATSRVDEVDAAPIPVAGGPSLFAAGGRRRRASSAIQSRLEAATRFPPNRLCRDEPRRRRACEKENYLHLSTCVPTPVEYAAGSAG